MANKKQNGAYYTPENLAEFITGYLFDKVKGGRSLEILEPSAGDGVFVKSILNLKSASSYKLKIVAVEKNKKELNKLENYLKTLQSEKIAVSVFSEDFLSYQANCNLNFDLIIGNPPYIKKNYLTNRQKKISFQIHKSAGLSNFQISNVWPAFLLSCALLLKEKGILAFILPFELLQVKFSRPIREFLSTFFERTEIFTFDELLFESNGQDTILVIGEKHSEEKGIFFHRVKELQDLKQKKISFTQNNVVPNTVIKWSHHYLSSDQLQLLDNVKKSINTVDFYCSSQTGLVTAANKFFIVDENTIKSFKLRKIAKPIIQKGFYVNGSIVFAKKDFEKLKESGKPCYLLHFYDEKINKFPESIQKYLEEGMELKINQRYKCSIRDKWYMIPGVWPSIGMFFKRSHLYPKLIVNEAGILVTDSAYRITMREQYSIYDLVYSFYNSLTLVFSELDGRFYGGGVLELTPNEFKRLPLPYTQISRSSFNQFKDFFEKEDKIEKILKLNDEDLLLEKLGLDKATVSQIQKIRAILVQKRIRG